MVVTNEISQSPVIENIWFIQSAENCKSGIICAKNLTDVFHNRSSRYIYITVFISIKMDILRKSRYMHKYLIIAYRLLLYWSGRNLEI